MKKTVNLLELSVDLSKKFQASLEKFGAMSSKSCKDEALEKVHAEMLSDAIRLYCVINLILDKIMTDEDKRMAIEIATKELLEEMFVKLS